MKDEIKEILQLIGNCCYYGEISKDKCEKYCNYITNLQTIEQQYSAILSENAELENKITNLQKENERLNNIIKEFKMYLIKKIEYMKYHSIERMVAYDDSLAKFKDLEGKK